MSNTIRGWRVEVFDQNKEAWIISGFHLEADDAQEEADYLDDDYENVRVVECDATFVDRKVRRVG